MTTAALTAVQRHNFRQYYQDILWWGVLAGSTIAFVAVYLVRLGASTFQLALLAAGPAVVNLFFAIPAGHWLKSRDLRKTTFWASLFFRGGYLLLVFLPLVFPHHQAQIWVVILIYLLAAVPGTVLAISFNALFAELVSPDWRPYVVGRRNALLSLSITVTSLGVGAILDRVMFPLGYQIVFGLGFLGAALSSSHLFRLLPAEERSPEIGKPIEDRAIQNLQRTGDVVRRVPGLRFLTRQTAKGVLRFDLLKGPFGLFLLAYLAFYTAQYLPTPLFPVYLVDEIGISEGVLSIGGALFYLAVMLISLRIDRLSKRVPAQTLLTLGVTAYAIFPIMISLWGTVAGVLTAHALGGMAWGFAGSSTINHLMDTVPDDDRPAHMALNHITLNIGILAGSFFGPLLGNLVGLRTAILAAGVLRILAGLLVGRAKGPA
jgi:MFS family permease